MLQACDACSDMGMAYSVIVQCADCVVFPNILRMEGIDGELKRAGAIKNEMKSDEGCSK